MRLENQDKKKITFLPHPAHGFVRAVLDLQKNWIVCHTFRWNIVCVCGVCVDVSSHSWILKTVYHRFCTQMVSLQCGCVDVTSYRRIVWIVCHRFGTQMVSLQCVCVGVWSNCRILWTVWHRFCMQISLDCTFCNFDNQNKEWEDENGKKTQFFPPEKRCLFLLFALCFSGKNLFRSV